MKHLGRQTNVYVNNKILHNKGYIHAYIINYKYTIRIYKTISLYYYICREGL